MAYLATERAVAHGAPTRAVSCPNASSILVLGIRYPRPEPARTASLNQGQIAAYARQLDYHEVLKPRLQALVAFIEAQVGAEVPNRWYTDTGPLLETRAGPARRPGLDRQEQHADQPGTGLLLPAGRGLAGHPAGRPTRPSPATTAAVAPAACRPAPRSALAEERTIDARRCISYLTIELKGAIPTDLRSDIGDWLFGCDICQQVCPWNQRFAPADGEPAFAARPETSRPQPAAELSLSPQEFNRKFKGSPLKRSKRRGYLRNAAVVLGNNGNSAAVPALAASLQNEAESLVRQHAAWALGQIGGQVARQRLQQAQADERDQDVLAEIKLALGANAQA